jgi:hypothetical protein
LVGRGIHYILRRLTAVAFGEAAKRGRLRFFLLTGAVAHNSVLFLGLAPSQDFGVIDADD